jgi:hypothetical protein
VRPGVVALDVCVHTSQGVAVLEFEATGRAVMLTMPGTAFGDIALVPGPWMKHPKGIRDIEEWYISTAIRKDYVHAIFEKQCEIGLQNIETLINLLGARVTATFVTGTDFGTQRGLFISKEAYREMFKPYHIAVCKKIHELTKWKVFIYRNEYGSSKFEFIQRR